MERTLSYKRIALVYSIPLAIFSMTFFLVFGGYLNNNPELVIPLAIDLLITAPVLYFLAIRKTTIPNFTAISVLVIGTLITSYILPKENFPELNVVGNIILPLLEIGIVSTLIYGIYTKRKEIISNKNAENDYLSLIRESAEKTFGKTRYASFFASEIAFIYYGFFNWKKVIPKENEFTYHIKSGVGGVLGTLGAVLVIEAFAMHLLIEQWSEIAAWILTFGSVYAIIQITAHIKACSRRLITVEKDILKLKYGLFGDVNIPFGNIESIELTRKIPKESKAVVKQALVDLLEPHNVILYLKEPVLIEGAYGMKKEGKILLLHIDDKERFGKILSLV